MQLTGIIIQTQNVFESDRLVTVMTESHGKIKVLANRANGKNSRYCGILDLGHCVAMQVHSGKSFLYLRHCNLVQQFPDIRRSYNKITMMHHFFDIVGRATAFDQPNGDLFHLLFTSLAALETSTHIHALRLRFYFNFLVMEGLLPPDHSQISTSFFSQAFYNYTGYHIAMPALLHG